jgi:hypothetical protein
MEDSYYTNFLKNVVETVEPPSVKYNVLSPTEYIKSNTRFLKMKLPELKQIAKEYKLHVSGNKSVVVERIETYLTKYKNSIVIQKWFRGHLVRYSFRLRGPAFKTRKCVNDSDFYSLEPLNEIEFERFFSYKDSAGFVYGFDLYSLLNLYKSKNKLSNPYNREHMPFPLVSRIFTLFQIIKLVFPNTVDSVASHINPPATIIPTIRATRPSTIQHPEQIMQTTPEIQRMIQMRNQLQTIQVMPISTRVREVFGEMDILGNYTNVAWFNNLSKLGYATFYRYYYGWWSVMSRMSVDMKRKICVLRDPFMNINILDQYDITSIDMFREMALGVIEAMVYTGIDIEHRKLGALQVLTMLTLVSHSAREAMPWLYESIAMRHT